MGCLHAFTHSLSHSLSKRTQSTPTPTPQWEQVRQHNDSKILCKVIRFLQQEDPAAPAVVAGLGLVDELIRLLVTLGRAWCVLFFFVRVRAWGIWVDAWAGRGGAGQSECRSCKATTIVGGPLHASIHPPVSRPSNPPIHASTLTTLCLHAHTHARTQRAAGKVGN